MFIGFKFSNILYFFLKNCTLFLFFFFALKLLTFVATYRKNFKIEIC